MSGIFLIVVAIVWMTAAVAITRWTTRSFRSLGIKVLVGIVVFPVILVAPLVDELVGARQFEDLCERYAVQVIDEQHAMNRRFVSEPGEADEFAPGTTVRIRIDPWVYKTRKQTKCLSAITLCTGRVVGSSARWAYRRQMHLSCSIQDARRRTNVHSLRSSTSLLSIEGAANKHDSRGLLERLTCRRNLCRRSESRRSQRARLINLLKSRMTEPVAQYIAANFSLVTHIETDDEIGSGFSTAKTASLLSMQSAGLQAL